MNLDGKYVLITGGARRLGKEMVLAVAEAGGNVIIHHGHSPAEALSLKTEIESLGVEAHVIQADFSVESQASSVIPQALEAGSLFALVNNASIFQNLDWASTDLEQWNRHFQINLTAPFLLSQQFAESLEQGERGRIINILDWRALRPRDDHFPYTVSKAALAALTKSLAVSLAPDIIVNGLALGAILPPSDSTGKDLSSLIDEVPAGRWADLRELKDAFLYLLTGPAYMTGEILPLDGGRHLI